MGYRCIKRFFNQRRQNRLHREIKDATKYIQTIIKTRYLEKRFNMIRRKIGVIQRAARKYIAKKKAMRILKLKQMIKVNF